MDQTSRFCSVCQKRTLWARPGTNHLLHLLVTLFLCGFWLPVWILASIKIGGWKCQSCGYKGSFGSSIYSLIALPAMCVLLFLMAVGFVTSSMRNTKAPPTAAVSVALQTEPQDDLQIESLPARFEVVATQRQTYFLWIDPQFTLDPAVYEQAIEAVCGDQPLCKLMFWADRAMVPSRLPLSDGQVAAQVAHYDRWDSDSEAFCYIVDGRILEPGGRRPADTPLPVSKVEEPEFRTWTDASGQHKTEAKLLTVESGQVSLLKANGATVKLPIERLSAEDQTWIKSQE